VQETGAARATEKFSPGGREKVAAKLVDVHRQLPHGLTRVDMVAHTGLGAYRSDSLDILDDARMSRNPGDRYQATARMTRELAHGVEVGAAGRLVGRVKDFHAAALRQREELYLVRRVVQVRRDDDVARQKIKGAQRLDECGRGVRHEG